MSTTPWFARCPSDSPLYRRATTALKRAMAELDSTRGGRRGRPTRKYVKLMNLVGELVGAMSNAVALAFMASVKSRKMARQVRRARARVCQASVG